METGVMVIYRSINMKNHCLRDFYEDWYEKGRSNGV